MTDALKKTLSEIELLIDKGDYLSAINDLQEIFVSYPNEGIIPFYYGNIARMIRADELALKYYLQAYNLGFDGAEGLFAMAFTQKELGMFSEAEHNFLDAIEKANEKDEKWVYISALAVFYLENDMFLKAEKMSKKLIEEFDTNYQGYHIHVISEAMRSHFDEAEAYLERVPSVFKNHPQYFIDKIELCKAKDDKEKLKQLLADETIKAVIPQVVLREMIMNMPGEEHAEEKEKFINTLAKEYHDKDAFISKMILEFVNKNYEDSAQLANVILENEKLNQGIRYYLALIFQIYNLYYLSGKKPSLKLIDWIEKAGNWCIAFAEANQVENEGEIVRESMQALFDEINTASQG